MSINQFTPVVDGFLVRADQVFDYVPLVSSVTNLVDLFQKVVSVSSEPTSRYYAHLKDKSVARCVALVLLPGIGNLFMAVRDVYDSIEQAKEEKRARIQQQQEAHKQRVAAEHKARAQASEAKAAAEKAQMERVKHEVRLQVERQYAEKDRQQQEALLLGLSLSF